MIAELTLENPAYGGDTIGRLPDGRAVFVPYGLPGETVRVKLVQQKKRYARGELLEILEASPQRIPARCRHFAECGGCHYQQMSYQQQLITKQAILQDQLERIGGLSHPPVAAPLPSPAQYNYRNQIQFQVSSGGKLGFFRSTKKSIIEVNECHLPQGPLNEVWPLLDIDPDISIKRIGLRLGAKDDVLVAFESEEPFNAEFNLEALPVSVVHINPEGVQILAGSPYSVIQVREREFQVSAGSFFQVNTALAEKMVAMIEDLMPTRPNLLLELYAGVGLFSAFLAGKVNKLVAIESSPSACDDFVLNLDEFDNVELYQGEVEEVLPLIDLNPDLVLLDPPRTGVAKKVLESIISLSPTQIIYISCDPATLARDSRILSEGGYLPQTFIPVDLFCQTYHIETISSWRRT
jgi:23S rRNA (uracil1939-C5)-methyltransferase